MTDYRGSRRGSFSSVKECNTYNRKSSPTLKTWFTRNLLLIITLLGVILGAVIGFCLRKLQLSDMAVVLISYPGELYMRVLKLLILPLIISTLITGSSSVNSSLNGKIAIRTFIYFFLTSCFNALLGVILAIIIHPGDPGINVTLKNVVETKKTASVLDSLLDLGRNIVSDNIFQATFQQAHTDIKNTTIKIYNESSKNLELMSKVERSLNYRLGINNIGIVFFCMIFGTVLGTIGPKGQVVKDLFSTIFEVVMKMVKGVLWITPFGLCSIIAGKIVSVENIAVVISQLGWFIITIILGVYIYQLIFLQLIYFIFLRKNPFKYYLSFIQGTLTAFATASAAAALPINFDVMDNKLKMNPSVTRFVLPIGVNINMDGTANFLATATVFMAQMARFQLDGGTLVTIWLTSTIMSFSSASVPSAALVLLLMILSSIGIPVNDLPLLFAVDWLVDRFRTTNNMLGDCYTVAVVEKLSKKELNQDTNVLKKFIATSDDEAQMV